MTDTSRPDDRASDPTPDDARADGRVTSSSATPSAEPTTGSPSAAPSATESTPSATPSSASSPREVSLPAFVAGLALVGVVVWLAFAALSGAAISGPDDRWLVLSHDRWRGDGCAAWAAETTRGGAWRPLFWLSLAADRALGGAGDLAASLHGGTLVLHALGCAAVGVLIHGVATFAADAAGARRPRLVLAASLAAALAWGVHPLRAEAVASLTARGDVIGALALALAGIAWMRAVGGTSVRRGAVVATAALGSVAVLAAPGAAAYPAALLGLTLWMGRVAPTSVAAGGAGRALAAASLPGCAGLVLALMHAPAAAPLGALPAGLAAVHRAIAPLRDTITPALLHPAHGGLGAFPEEIRFPLWGDAAFFVALVWVAARSVRRAGGLGAAALGYAGFVAVRVLVVREPFGSDTDAHLATLPVFAAVAAGAASMAGRAGAVATAAFAGAAVVAGIALQSVLPGWASPATLWERVLAADPTNDRALSAKGDAALAAGPDAGGRRQAEAWYRRSLDSGGWRPWAQAGIGALQLEGGDARVGIERLTEATRLAPWLPEPRFQLGALLHRLGEHGAAISHLRLAVALDPESGPAWFQLGISARAAGDVTLAATAFERAVAIEPGESRYAAELDAARASAARAAAKPR